MRGLDSRWLSNAEKVLLGGDITGRALVRTIPFIWHMG